MKEDESGVTDVKWEAVEQKQDESGGKIKFRKKDRKTMFVKISKGIVFILVAVFSGGISAAYITGKEYSQLKNENSNKSVVQGNNISQNYVGNYADNSQNSIAKVAQAASQSVVEISDTNTNGADSSSNTGSGIIFRSDGYIVTNYHLIQGADKHFVWLSNVTQPLLAKVIGFDVLTDLAVLKVDRKNLQAVVFGDASKVQLGDYVVAIGSQFGDTTHGIISSPNKRPQYPIMGSGGKFNVLQTDATINSGNNGGALCDMNGEVIGINNLKITEAYNEDGTGTAVSINDAKVVINAIMKNGHVSRPFLGIQSQDYIPENGKNSSGVMVKDIISGTQAVKSGIKAKDIIVEFDSVKIESTEGLQEILEKHKVGDSVPTKIIRNGKEIKINIVLSELPDKERP